MLKKDLLKIIENAKDDEDINSLLEGSEIADTFKASGLTIDAFKKKLKEKEFKSYIEGENKKYFDKEISNWKESNLEKELEPFINEKYPDLVIDPTKKELLEMKKELAAEKAANARKDLLAQATKYASDKKLPVSIVERCLAEDLDKTKEVIDSLATDWATGLEALTTEKMKSKSHIPGQGGDGESTSLGSLFATEANKSNSAPSDPWAAK